jgi:hypothetical protein
MVQLTAVIISSYDMTLLVVIGSGQPQCTNRSALMMGRRKTCLSVGVIAYFRLIPCFFAERWISTFFQRILILFIIGILDTTDLCLGRFVYHLQLPKPQLWFIIPMTEIELYINCINWWAQVFSIWLMFFFLVKMWRCVSIVLM